MNTAPTAHPHLKSFGLGDKVSFVYRTTGKTFSPSSGTIDGVYDRRTVRVKGHDTLVDAGHITDWEEKP